jgi:hypothetical protein
VLDKNFNRQRTRTDVRRSGQGPCQLARRTSEASNSSWGSEIDSKSDRSFRYCFLNICGLPVDALHEKHQLLTQCMQKNSIDLLGLSEINLNFKNIIPSQQWKHRFAFQRHASHYAINEHSTSTDRRLFGGTGFLTTQATSQKLETKGEDPLGLGCWTWALLTGRQGIKVRVIQGYRPVLDTSNRAGSVYSQQEKYFYDIKEYWEPRQAFLDDLGAEIRKWKADGNLIILGLNLNDDTWDSPAADTINDWAILNALKHHHPTLPNVATCNKNTRNKPVDGIWCSPSIEILQAGMTGFGSPHIGHTNHRMLWVDFDADLVFGYRTPPLAPIAQLGITLHDPRLGHRYNKRLKKARHKLNILNQIFWLEQQALDGTFDNNDERLYIEIMRQDDQLREQCKIKVRKQYAGSVAYSDIIGRGFMTAALTQGRSDELWSKSTNLLPSG